MMQVNLEYLARVGFFDEQKELVYPDSVVGTGEQIKKAAIFWL